MDGLLLDHPFRGIRGDFACQTVVSRGTQSVNIRPGTKIAPALVLLDGSKAVLQDGIRGLGQHFLQFRRTHFPNRAEVQQLRCSVGLDHNIVGRNVPVDQTFFVDFFQNLHHRPQNRKQFRRNKRTAQIPDVMLQIHALDIFHDDVGSVILFEEIVNIHDAGNTPQPCQCTGFPQEPVAAAAVKVADGIAAENRQRLAGFPGNEAVGIIFLDGHRNVQIAVPAHVSNAETALTQFFTHHVLSLQHGADGQLMGIVGNILVVTAMLADGAVVFHLHTANAAFCHRNNTSSGLLTVS